MTASTSVSLMTFVDAALVAEIGPIQLAEAHVMAEKDRRVLAQPHDVPLRVAALLSAVMRLRGTTERDTYAAVAAHTISDALVQLPQLSRGVTNTFQMFMQIGPAASALATIFLPEATPPDVDVELVDQESFRVRFMSDDRVAGIYEGAARACGHHFHEHVSVRWQSPLAALPERRVLEVTSLPEQRVHPHPVPPKGHHERRTLWKGLR